MARKKTLDDEQLTETFYYILLSITEPIHGYAIMQKVKEISDGTFEIGPASLYTSLKKMLTAELLSLKETEESDKKVYELTNRGREILQKDYQRRKAMVQHGYRILDEGRK